MTLLILILPWPVVNADAAEKRLVLYLMKHYNRFERPVYEPGTSLNLTMNVDLQQIIDLDEKNQLLKTSIWLTYHWHDNNLEWEPVRIFEKCANLFLKLIL